MARRERKSIFGNGKKGRPPGISAVTTEGRRKEVALLYSEGRQRAEIEQIISEKWGCNTRTVRSDLAELEARWTEASRETAAECRGRRIRVLEDLYRRALKARDLRAAAAVQDKLCKIEGVYAPVNVEHTGTVTVEHLTTSAQRTRVAYLLERAGLPQLPEGAVVDVEVEAAERELAEGEPVH